MISDTTGLLLNVHDEEWHGKWLIRWEESTQNTYEYEEVESYVEEIVYIDGEWYSKNFKKIRSRIVTQGVDLLDYETNEVIGNKTISKIKSTRSITTKVRDLNSEYDDSLEYIPRSQRPEWYPIGLLGKCKLLKGEPCTSKMEINNGSIRGWLVSD